MIYAKVKGLLHICNNPCMNSLPHIAYNSVGVETASRINNIHYRNFRNRKFCIHFFRYIFQLHNVYGSLIRCVNDINIKLSSSKCQYSWDVRMGKYSQYAFIHIRLRKYDEFTPVHSSKPPPWPWLLSWPRYFASYFPNFRSALPSTHISFDKIFTASNLSLKINI